jgi:acylphosphatase
VANRWDGSVETVAEGSQDTLEQYLSYLHEGPPSAVVRGVESSWLAATGEFDSFEVQG